MNVLVIQQGEDINRIESNLGGVRNDMSRGYACGFMTTNIH